MITLLKVALVFAAIIFLMGRKVRGKKLPVGAAMLGGCFLLALLMRLPVPALARALVKGAVGPDTLSLVAIVLLIFIFEAALSETGQIQRISDGFKKLVTDSRLVVAAIPALVGLLPMPGGALFSAPAMKSVGSELNTSAEEQTFLNYWFRHVWEYTWPLYPAIPLAAHLAGRPITQIMAAQYPLSIAAIVAGSVMLAVRVRHAPPSVVRERAWLHELLVTLRELLPIWFIIGALLFAKMGVHITMVIAFAGVLAVNKTRLVEIPRIIRKGISWEGLILVVAVMIFVEVLGATGAVRMVGGYLSALGIGVLPLVILVPFIVGLLTGATLPYVGISFPILLPMIPDDHSKLLYVMVAYGCGYVGILLSPFHLCLVLTTQYFGAQMRGVYRLLWLPSLFVAAAALALFWVGRFRLR